MWVIGAVLLLLVAVIRGGATEKREVCGRSRTGRSGGGKRGLEKRVVIQSGVNGRRGGRVIRGECGRRGRQRRGFRGRKVRRRMNEGGLKIQGKIRQ